MRGQSFRLHTPTLGITTVDGQNLAITVPKGAVISVVDGPMDGTRLVDVTWDGKTLMMFTIDLKQRGQQL
jgi:hypothetical protein